VGIGQSVIENSFATTAALQWVRSEGGCLRLSIDTKLYPETCIFRTCYLFTDRAYVYMRSEQPDEVIVEFRAKQNSFDLTSVIGDFGNELINQRIRLDLAKETQKIREMIVAQAFSEADLNGTE